MVKFHCTNCNFEFEAENASQCGRCSSAKIEKKFENKPATIGEGDAGKPVEPRRFVYSPLVTDTKESWMKFHGGTDFQVCPGCGGKDFEFIWKRKEKVCKKCGEIMPLKRR